MCTNTLTRPFSSSSSSLYGDSLLLLRSGKFLKFVMKLRSTPGGLYSADDEPEQRVRVSHLRAGRRTGFQVCEICTWVLASCSNPCKKASCQIWILPISPLTVASSYRHYSLSVSVNAFFWLHLFVCIWGFRHFGVANMQYYWVGWI